LEKNKNKKYCFFSGARVDACLACLLLQCPIVRLTATTSACHLNGVMVSNGTGDEAVIFFHIHINKNGPARFFVFFFCRGLLPCVCTPP
jgi:hypothetical protein